MSENCNLFRLNSKNTIHIKKKECIFHQFSMNHYQKHKRVVLKIEKAKVYFSFNNYHIIASIKTFQKFVYRYHNISCCICLMYLP